MGSSKLLIALNRMDTECRWSTVTWVSTFEMGLIHTSFQVCGKYSFEIQLWMIAVRRPTRCSAECFTNWATGWFTPITQSIHSCLTHPTTGLFTILKIIPEILVCLLMEHDFSSLWWKIPGRKRIYEKVIPFFCQKFSQWKFCVPCTDLPPFSPVTSLSQSFLLPDSSDFFCIS